MPPEENVYNTQTKSLYLSKKVIEVRDQGTAVAK
jgi:hypothetical protein